MPSRLSSARLSGLLSLIVLGLGAYVQAATPSLVSYQGRLTDLSGTPVADGNYSVAFTVYDASTGGTALWTETQNVATVGGLFSVQLGAVTALDATVFTDPNRWLGVKVGADPELVPRTRFTSSPYADRIATVDGSTGGQIAGPVEVTGAGFGKAQITDVGGEGEAIYLWQEDGFPFMGLEPDANGIGGFFRLWGGNPSSGMYVDGNATGGGDLTASIYGTQSGTIFNTGQSGDASVQLPNSAVAAKEILDEPGLSANYAFGNIVLGRSLMTDLATTTISIPAPGYVLAIGTVGEFDFKGTTGNNWAFIQIDTNSFGSMIPDLTTIGAYTFPDTNYYFYAFSGQRVMYFSAPGTYTFRVQALQTSLAIPSATIRAYQAKISAVYIPTSYGPVTVPVPGNDVSQFEQVSKMTGSDRASAVGLPISDNVYTADLRDLELKVARTEAEAQKARATLLEAQLKKQPAVRNVAGEADKK